MRGLRTDAGRPLLLETAHGRGRFLYFASPLWLRRFDAGAARCTDAMWRAIGDASIIRATLPVRLASADGARYLLIENSQNAPECSVECSGRAEMIFGSGKLTAGPDGFRVESPRHAVVRITEQRK